MSKRKRGKQPVQPRSYTCTSCGHTTKVELNPFDPNAAAREAAKSRLARTLSTGVATALVRAELEKIHREEQAEVRRIEQAVRGRYCGRCNKFESIAGVDKIIALLDMGARRERRPLHGSLVFETKTPLSCSVQSRVQASAARVVDTNNAEGTPM